MKSLKWLFDFDLTLYGYDEDQVLTALDRNITRFVMERFAISENEADAVRKSYWKDYGTTLSGLRALHAVSPTEYFDFIHSGDGLKEPKRSVAKRQLLLQLPGKRWIFTNARRDWAERGVRSMGIEDCFDGIFDIEQFGWMSKPNPVVYAEVERLLGVTDAQELVLVDDRADNLATARARGWRTVHVHPRASDERIDCDLRIQHLLELAECWRQLGA